MSRKLSVTGGGEKRAQSMSGPPAQGTVKVAVLPPRLPEDMAPPTGVGTADVFSWDESVNWKHNEKIDKPEAAGGRKFLRGVGLSRERQSAREGPPFVFREVTYDVWRKHYAKDKDGKYKGTEAPAEDCLLLPEDVQKWSFGPAETKADQWTRGKAALPVYDQTPEPSLPTYSQTAPEVEPAPVAPAQRQGSASNFTADGKTSAQIIAEAEAKTQRGDHKLTWKERMSKAKDFALMGANTG